MMKQNMIGITDTSSIIPVSANKNTPRDGCWRLPLRAKTLLGRQTHIDTYMATMAEV